MKNFIIVVLLHSFSSGDTQCLEIGDDYMKNFLAPTEIANISSMGTFRSLNLVIFHPLNVVISVDLATNI